MSLQQTHNFKTTFRNRTLSSLLRGHRERLPGTRKALEKLVLDVAPGVVPSAKPAVRIYVGSEPAQFRAERVLVWSIMQQRDPSRVYEIYLMKDLAGFRRRDWKTGFTCYRYAIPTFAGGAGRAIYNDVDQIYLGDPAELFDMDMGGKGMLGINERETSVMLIDCAQMIRIWHLDDAHRGDKHNGFRAAVHEAKLWGQLPGAWNARDGEYVADQSKVLHFTTLQTQPWQPFPDELRYEPHHLADLWLGLERAADAAGFTLFTKERPSRHFGEQRGATAVTPTSRDNDARLDTLIRETGARDVLDYSELQPIDGIHDGIVCRDLLQRVTDDDVPWVLDELFAHARAFVYVAVTSFPPRKQPRQGSGVLTPQPEHWWREQMGAAGRRHPAVRWDLRTAAARANGS